MSGGMLAVAGGLSYRAYRRRNRPPRPKLLGAEEAGWLLSEKDRMAIDAAGVLSE